MKTKHFPNGFHSWMETHYEVFEAISSGRFTSANMVSQLRELGGLGFMYLLAEAMTDEFEMRNQGRAWDGEFFDEIGDFIDEVAHEDFSKEHRYYERFYGGDGTSNYEPRATLVVYSEKMIIGGSESYVLIDHIDAHDTPELAEAAYAEVLEKENLYSASLCSIIKSTDY